MAASDVLNYFAQPSDNELVNNILTINGGMTMTNIHGTVNQDQIIAAAMSAGSDVSGSGPSIAGTFPLYADTTGKVLAPSAIALTNNTLIGITAGALANISAGTNITISGGTISASGGSAFTINTQLISTVGSFTYTPTPGMAFVIVELQAGGGGSGGVAISTGGAAVSAGGGGGGYLKFLLTAAQVGASLSGIVGAGGAGGATGENSGIDGDDTSLATLSPWAATGGGPGGFGALLTISAVGTDVGGVTGPNGIGTGKVINDIYGNTGGGSFFVASAFAVCGGGGNSFLGLGGYSVISAVSAGGNAPPGYGGGGGGVTGWNDANSYPGTQGGDGVAIFTEFIAS